MCAPYFVNLNNNTFQLKTLLFFVHLRSQQKRTESHLQLSNIQCCHFEIVILRVAISNVQNVRLQYRHRPTDDSSTLLLYFIIVACRISSRLKWYKNYKNRLRLAKVIIKNKMLRFYGSLCIIMQNPAFWWILGSEMWVYIRAAGGFHSHNHFDRRWRRHTCRTSSGIRRRWWELSAAATRPTSCRSVYLAGRCLRNLVRSAPTRYVLIKILAAACELSTVARHAACHVGSAIWVVFFLISVLVSYKKVINMIIRL